MTGDEFPAWVIALAALASAVMLFSARPMPLFVRVALISPRLAICALYGIYTLFDVDIATRSFVVRLLFLLLFLTESVTFGLVRLEWQKLRHLGRRLE
jgi:hypothetical protein